MYDDCWKKNADVVASNIKQHLIRAHFAEIRARAYIIWLQTGRADPVSNWLQAEREILAQYSRPHNSETCFKNER